MQLTNFTKSIFALLVSTATLACASPVAIANRDIWDPAVTSPDASTVWIIGQQQLITWYAAVSLSDKCLDTDKHIRDTSDPPTEITDTVGEVRLSKGFVILDGT